MELLEMRSVQYENGTPPMSDAEEDEYITRIPGWELDREGIHKITREFKFGDFKKALAFVIKVGEIAELEDHHPDIHIYYSKVVLELSTHSIGGLSGNDFIVAAKINALRK